MKTREHQGNQRDYIRTWLPNDELIICQIVVKVIHNDKKTYPYRYPHLISTPTSIPAHTTDPIPTHTTDFTLAIAIKPQPNTTLNPYPHFCHFHDLAPAATTRIRSYPYPYHIHTLIPTLFLTVIVLISIIRTPNVNCKTLRTLILRTHIAALGWLKPRLVEGQLKKLSLLMHVANQVESECGLKAVVLAWI